MTATATKAKTKKSGTIRRQRKQTNQRIRIKICAYDHKIIDTATKTIIDTAERNSAQVVGLGAAADGQNNSA